MIKVNKPARAPDVLVTKGKNKRRVHSRAYTGDPAAYKAGTKTFEFDGDTYGDKSVKGALRTAQHDKCCFCESKIGHISYGDVEHFRPKAAVKQEAGDPLDRPGYYWLAYEWDNLFLSCQICNQRQKGNLFPLRSDSQRARSHKDDIRAEEPLFIDPAKDDPGEHIGFRQEIAHPLPGSKKGHTTIVALDLNRKRLRDRRWELFDKMRVLKTVADADPPLPQTPDAKRLLKRAVLDSAEYAAMTRAALD